MNRTEILLLLNELFDVPVDTEKDLDLRDFIKDSIDVGEFVAELRQRYGLNVEVSDFKAVVHLQQVVDLLKSKDKI